MHETHPLFNINIWHEQEKLNSITKSNYEINKCRWAQKCKVPKMRNITGALKTQL